MVVTLRRAEAEDREEIAGLFARHLEALGCDPDPELDADMSNPTSSYTVFLVAALEDGSLIGMGGIDRGEVRRVFVLPEHRQRGLARRITEELVAESRAQGQRDIRAVVAGGNLPARRLFTALGFRPTGCAPDHLQMKHCEIFDGSEAC